MSAEYFKCLHCEKFTRHINVGMQGGLLAKMRREKSKNIALKFFSNVVGGFDVYCGLTKAAELVTGKGIYKCCECGLVSMWNKDGTMDSLIYYPDE